MHFNIQLDAGATNEEVRFRAEEKFRPGWWTKESTLARAAAAPRTNFEANHGRAPGGRQDGGEASHAQEEVQRLPAFARAAALGINAGASACLGTVWRAKALSRELVL